MAAARDLLFGLLALQNGMVSRDQLVAAFGAWTAAPDRTLADLLAGPGALRPEHRPLLDALVEAHLKMHGGDPEKSLAALDLNRSTRESLASAGGPEVEATLAHVGSGPGSDGDDRTAGYAVGAASADGQRFRVLRPHARGGLGAVFVAVDAELNREVALKQILERHADDPTSRARFLLEAEITGGLEHPGIVPVYGLGSYAGGRPFYAMRFIRGDTLKEAGDRFHADDVQRKDPGRRSLELRKLLRRFVDVCNAIDYAHSRGVLHRDIKPGNIIVGKHGETLVVDWGLAKATGRAEPGAEERTLVPSSAGGSAETLPGSALGTPAYMSPEQARGDLEHLGPRSDVYSLGATLYCLLTGQPPLEGDDIGEVLRRAQRAEFPRPRLRDATIDAALEAVCLKAMALRPEDRYATPRLLAEDIERWMADESVGAWREPMTRRLLRWLTRHRTGVTAAAAAVLAGVVGLTAVLGVQASANARLSASLARETDANRRLNDANAELRRSRAAVRARYDLAVEAIRTFHTGVSEDFLLKEDRFKPLRDRLLNAAADFYGKLGAILGRETDAAARRALARANFELADLTARVGRREDALATHRAVLAMRRELAGTPGAGAEAQAELGRSLAEVARLLESIGRAEDAEAALGEAVALLVGPAVGSPEARSALAACRFALGGIQFTTNRHGEALATYRLALADQEALAAAAGAPEQARRDLSDTIHRVGILLDQPGTRAEAEAAFRRSLAIRRELAARHPDAPASLYRLAVSHNSLGLVLRELGRPLEAEAEFRAGLAIRRELVERNPGVTEFRNGLANIRLSLALLLYATGRPVEAEVEFRAALAQWRDLAAEHPTVTEYRSRLADAHLRLADLMSDTGRPADAEAEYRAALAVQRELVERNPAIANFRRRLSETYNNLGSLLLGVGRAREAELELRRSLELRRALAAANPKAPLYRSDVALIHNNLGAAMSATGRAREARAEVERALAIRRELSADRPREPAGREELAASLISLGDLDNDAGRPDQAAASLGEAVALLERLADEHPAVNDYRIGLAGALTGLGRARYRGGRRGAAVEPLRRAAALRDSIGPMELDVRYDRARGLALLASATASAAAADRAMDALRAAIAAGYRSDPARLLADADLASLRDRADFRLLMMDLAMPAAPFAPAR